MNILDPNLHKKQRLKDDLFSHARFDEKIISFRQNDSFFMQSLPGTLSESNPAIDQDMLQDLQQAKLLNWCRTSDKVFPVKTKSDGNCLCHAVSTCVWGFDDEKLTLRKLMHLAISAATNFQRWKNTYESLAKIMGTLHDWNREWESVVTISSPNSDNSTAVPYAHLEAIHIFALTQILRRPIIILGDSTARTIAGASLQENDICGIYLPLEWPSEKCCKYPVILGYSLNHFCPLLPRKKGKGNSVYNIPVVTHNGASLPVRFLSVIEEKKVGEILKTYLQVREIPLSSDDSVSLVLCTELLERPMSSDMTKAFGGIDSTLLNNHEPGNATLTNFQGATCLTPGCKFFGTPASGNMCSECLEKYLQNAEVRPAAQPSAPPPSMPLSIKYVDLSIMPETCAAGCGYRCSINTHPFCHECAAKPTTTTSPAALAEASLFDPGHTTTTSPPALAEASLFDPGQTTTTSPAALAEASLFGPGQTRKVDTVQTINKATVELLPSQGSSSNTKKQICEVPGCTGVRFWGDHCQTCAGMKAQTTRNENSFITPGMTGYGEKTEDTEIGIGTSGLEETSELVESGGSGCAPLQSGSRFAANNGQKKCASPMCCTLVLSPSTLCTECLNILMSRAKKRQQKSTIQGNGMEMQQAVNRPAKNSEPIAVQQHKMKLSLAENGRAHSAPMGSRCKTLNCPFYGDPSFDGFCTKCYTSMSLAQAPSLKCKTPGCSLYGDASTNGLCNRCFSNRPAGTQLNDPFTAMMCRVENEKKLQKMCKASSCRNFGNPRHEGFCNDCYPKYLNM